MKKGALVRIINEKKQKALCIDKEERGIVLQTHSGIADVLFFNPKVMGEYTIKELSIHDLSVESEVLPKEIEQELFSDIEKVYKKAKVGFTPVPFKIGDRVQLIVEDDRYSKHGIHKDAIGCVVDDTVIQGKIEVDFYEPEEAAAYDSAMAVKTEDLKAL